MLYAENTTAADAAAVLTTADLTPEAAVFAVDATALYARFTTEGFCSSFLTSGALATTAAFALGTDATNREEPLTNNEANNMTENNFFDIQTPYKKDI